jgi:glutathione S-transferase
VSCITTELDAQALWIHRKHEAMAEHFGRIPPAVTHAKQHFVRINQHLCTTYLQRPPPAKPVPAISPLQVSMPTDTSATHSNHSSERPRLYLMGNAFTAVDILYVHCLDWSRAIGWESTWASMESDQDSEDNEHVTTPYLTLQAYVQRCHDRPAYQRAKQLRDAMKKDSTQNNSTSTTAKL